MKKDKAMEMFNPPHPSEIIREDCLEPLGLTVTAAAAWLGVSRQSLSELLNGHNGVSADIAIRLEKAGWSNAETCLGVQTAYDLWQAKQRVDLIHVKRYPTPDARRTRLRLNHCIRPDDTGLFRSYFSISVTH